MSLVHLVAARRSVRAGLAALLICTAFLFVSRGVFAQDHGARRAHDRAASAGAVDTRENADSQSASPEAHAPVEHEAVEHESHALKPLNWTDIWDKQRPAILALAINFGVLMTLYYILGKAPVVNALKQRRVTIGKEIDEAQSLLAEAKERAKKYQADLKNVEADAATAKGALVTAAKGEVEHLLSEARERAERLKRDAERLVEQERKQLRVELLVETVGLSVEEASRILRASVTAEDHARLAQDLLGELSRKPSAKTTGSGARLVVPTAGSVS